MLLHRRLSVGPVETLATYPETFFSVINAGRRPSGTSCPGFICKVDGDGSCGCVIKSDLQKSETFLDLTVLYRLWGGNVPGLIF